jgi:formylglycine-generating enzyme required for sulfatase activity
MKKNIAWLIVIVFIGLISLNLTVAQASSPADYPLMQAATPTPEDPTIGSTRISETDQMAQVYVPSGDFIMGSTDIEAKQTIEDGRAYPEIPQHTVYVDGFWIDKYEVTTSQYAMCVEDGVCDPPFTNKSFTRQEYYGNPEYADYPVIWVKWEMART